MTIKKIIIYSGILLVITTNILVYSLVELSKSEQIIQDVQKNRDISLLLADELKESSRGLTSAVQKFVVTGDESYAVEYMDIAMIRAGEKSRPNDREIAPGQLVSLGKLMDLADYSEEELSLLRKSAILSDALMDIEIEAMNAVRGLFPNEKGEYSLKGEPDREKAIELVFSRGYENEVKSIMDPMTLLRQKLDSRLDSAVHLANTTHDQAIRTVWTGFIAIMGMFIAFLFLVAWVIVRPILLCDMFAKQAAGGIFDVPLNYTSKNEIGSLAESLRLMLQSLLERIGLKEHMRYYSAVISSVDAGVIIKNKSGLITDWNSGAECILGYRPEEIIGCSTKDYAPEESHAGIDEIGERLKNGEHITHVEVVRKHKDGRLIDCSSSYTPIFDSDGIFDGSVSIFHDITEKKAADQKAYRFAAIVAIADAGIVMKDKEGIVLEWNIGAENILGYKPKEIVGHSSKYYIPEEAHADIDEIEERLKNGEHITHVEVVRKHKDGKLIDCSATYTPVFDDDRSYIGSVAVFQDISEKKLMEHALKEAVYAAEEASKAKSTFLANMSHEIRTPMNGVIGFAELALDEDGLSGIVKDYLSKIKSSAGCLLDILNDILDISKIEAGAMDLEIIPFSLHDVFRECESISEPKAREKGIDLYFYAEPFIGGRLMGDPTKLRQILLNLLSNAIKFTNYGMVKLTAALGERTEDTVKIHFDVKDSGIGMKHEQIQRIFDPFAQADSTTTRKYGGTGLGLSITKSFVDMMGGEISVESTPDLGSKFSFSLVFETASEPSIEECRKERPFNAKNKPVFKGEVLVCEDNSTNQEVIVKHLSKIGISPVVAPNGKIGLEEVKKRREMGKPFDLILMDIHMPVMDGLETTKKLLGMRDKTPIIALTANAMSTDKENYMRQGMLDYLSKPFTAEELWSCLERHLKPVAFMQCPKTAGTKKEGALYAAGGILNKNEGLEKSACDEQLYRRIQRNFYKDNRDVMPRLNEAILNGNIELAHRLAHTLKGTAGLIGAEKLAQIAYGVETALSRGETENLTGQMKELEFAIQEILTILEPLSVKNDAVEKTESIDMDNTIALIEKVSPLLEVGNPESVGFIDEIRSVLMPLGEPCNTLVEQIEEFDFDIAFETIHKIRISLAK